MGQILTVVGYAVGTYFGYPQLGAVVGGIVGAAVTKQPGQQGPRLGDLRVQGTEYGQPIPWVFGSPRLAGQIVWASNRREIANTEKVGKGGGQKVTTFTYEVDLLIVLSENVTAGVAREWLNGELVFNGVPKAGVWTDLIVYTGVADQLPDPTYEAAVGVGNAPAYRGRTSLMVKGLQLGQGGQIGNLTSEFGVSGLISGETGFLCQFEDLASPGVVVAEVGPDLQSIPGEPNITLDTVNKKFEGASGVGSARSAIIPMSSQTEAWRWEWWGFYTSTDFTPAVVTIESNSNLTFVEFEFGWSAFGISFRFIGNSGPIGGQTVTVPSSTVPRPAANAWYHAAIQFDGNGSSGRISLFFDGQFVAALPCGTTPFGTDKTHSRILFDRTGTFSNQWDSTIFRSSLPIDEVWPETGYVVPVAPFSVNTGTVQGWYDSTPDPDGLMEAADALMLRAGYEADEYDVSALSGEPLYAIATSGVSSTRAILETLQTAYFFEAAKSDKVYIRPRPLVEVVDIPFEDLGTAADAVNDDEPLALTVGNELEVPAQVSVSYANMLADYNVGTEHSDRLLTGQETNQVVQLGIGMLPAKAKGVADALLFDQMASLTRTTIRLPLKYAFLEPGDVFMVTNQDGRQYRLRSQTKRDNLLIIEHECSLDDATALTSAQVTSDDYALTEEVRQIAPTIWEPMDIPLLRDADNQAGFYFALAPNRAIPEDEWPGAVAVRSWSADAFENLFTSGEACVMGVCTTTLGDFEGGSGRFDEGHMLTVRVTGELASTTRADMLDDLSINAALVGSEILRFRLAELLGTVDGENEYRLSGFVRGQRGTEQHIGTHVAAERFVLLNASLRRVLNQNSEIGVLSEVKAVTLNTLLSAVTAESFTDTGVGLKPFSVAGLRALADGADIVLTWNRRTRLSYRYGGTVGASVPLGEASEAYRIDVYDGATLVNTYSATDGTYTYAAADITADGFTTGDPITFVVRQLSEIVGPGFPATIERAAP